MPEQRQAISERPWILVAEDDEAVRKLVVRVLSQHALNLLVAESAEEALKLSRDHNGPLHLLLSDIQLPAMTGIELGTKVSQERPESKVILMSGMDSGLLILNSGWHFLPKPFVPSQLLSIILTSLALPAS